MSPFIEDLPEAVIEYIFSYLSPYRDLKQCMLVNKAWTAHALSTIRKLHRDFHNAIISRNITWQHSHAEDGPTISRRYSHSACYCGESMYVFGGCTTASTTYNDLWRLDLATRCWIRPLATGTYPPPKACATMVSYQNRSLILFGGWTHTSPHPLQQNWHVFNHLHIYNTISNRWTRVVTSSAYPGMAGHTASIVGHHMVVFGGLHCNNGWGPFSSSNEVWVLNLNTLTWQKKKTTAPEPHARYSHSQIVVDDHHLLIFGGCGGPNMLLSDMWLLIMNDGPDSVWEWKKVDVLQKENSAPHLSFHPACKVGNHVVVLSKSQWSRTSPSCLPLLRPSRTWIPPRADIFAKPEPVIQPKPIEKENCINGKRGVLKRQFGRFSQNSPTNNNLTSSDEDESSSAYLNKRSTSLPKDQEQLGVAGPSGKCGVQPMEQDAVPSSSSSNFQPATMENFPEKCSTLGNSLSFHSVQVAPSLSMPKTAPSVRLNAMKNRQRQLESLDRMEQKIRNLRNRNVQSVEGQKELRPSSLSFSNNNVPSPLYSSKNSMYLYVLDTSQVISTGQVTWVPPQVQITSGLEEIILYSLVLGRGELVMFGGIQKDMNPTHQESGKTQVVSNSLHFISAKRCII